MEVNNGIRKFSSWILGLLSKYKSYKMPIKQIDELSEADLLKNPVWEYLMEDDTRAIDEGTVIARSPEEIHKIDWFYIALAEFELNNGLRLKGYVNPEESSIEYSQPCIFFPGGQDITFWFGAWGICEGNIKDVYQSIGLCANELFPIKWSCKYAPIIETTNKGFPTYGTPVFIGVGEIRGVIEGFGYSSNGETIYIR